MRTLQSRQAQANYFATQATHMFACTGDPGTGTAVANEATGGAPAYARKPLAGLWSAADSSAQVTATVTFDLPAGTYTWFGVATALTGSTQYESVQLATPVTYTSQAQHTQTYVFRAA